MIGRTTAAGLMLMTMGCTTVPPEQPERPGEEIREIGEGRCNPEAARHLVGRDRSEALGNEARRLTGAVRIRWIRPGDVVTMDYQSGRLNIHVDSRGRVTRFACG